MSTKAYTIESSAADFTVEEFAKLFEEYAMDEESVERTTFGMTSEECEQAAAILRAGRDANPVAFSVAMYRAVMACDLWRLEEAIRDDIAQGCEWAAFDALNIGFSKIIADINLAK